MCESNTTRFTHPLPTMTAYTITISILFALWLLPALAVIGLYLGELLRDRFACSVLPRQASKQAAEASVRSRLSRSPVQTYTTAEHVPDAVSAYSVPGTDLRFSIDTVRRVEAGSPSRTGADLHWELYLN